jgi:hypothetical protein
MKKIRLIIVIGGWFLFFVSHTIVANPASSDRQDSWLQTESWLSELPSSASTAAGGAIGEDETPEGELTLGNGVPVGQVPVIGLLLLISTYVVFKKRKQTIKIRH